MLEDPRSVVVHVTENWPLVGVHLLRLIKLFSGTRTGRSRSDRPTGGPTIGDCVVKYSHRMSAGKGREEKTGVYPPFIRCPNQHGLSLVNNSQEYHRSRAISERSTSTRHRLRWRGRGQPCPATTSSIMSCTGTIHMQMCSTISKSRTFVARLGIHISCASLGPYLTHSTDDDGER